MEQINRQNAKQLEQTKVQEKKQQNVAKETKNVTNQFSFSFADTDKLDCELRKPRTRAYMEIFAAIDMLSATDEEIIERLKDNMDEDMAEEFSDMSMEEILEEIRATFREEFKSVMGDITTLLHGVLAKCYIDGCECHAISADGEIIDHYGPRDQIPEKLKKGRLVYRKYPDCACVEVYEDCCRVINEDSTVIKIPNNNI